MPLVTVAALCASLIALASALAVHSVALAGDGAFQLVSILSTGEGVGAPSRTFATHAQQGPVVVASWAGVVDTQVLATLLGLGQIVLPAFAWSLAIVLCRRDRLVCATVSMLAGLSAATTWFLGASELVLAAPLTVLVAVFLWQPRPLRARDTVVAVAAASILVASYETALVTGVVLTIWGAWRATTGSSGMTDRVACVLVASLSAASAVVAVWGTQTGANPTHSRSLLYFVVSLEPWPFYVALLGITAVVAGLGPWLTGHARSGALVLGTAAIAVAVVAIQPNPVRAFQARGGVAIAVCAAVLFLWWRWIASRRGEATPGAGRREERLLVVVPVAFMVALVVASVQPIHEWSRSLEVFRAEVNRTQGVVHALDVLPPQRRDVLWGWTASSLSLVVRASPDAGVLADRDPAYVPFSAEDAREQLADEYVWDE